MNITIPNTSLSVSQICFGTGSIGSAVREEPAFRLLDLYVELDGNFIDTAHCYGDWVAGIERSASEKTIGRWMRARENRSEIVLATKGAHWLFDKPGVQRCRPADIRADLDASLDALQIDCIDLYWLHRDDPEVPVGEILDTLEAARAEGKIRHYGASNWQVCRMWAAGAAAADRGYAGFVADQVWWNAAVIANYPYGARDVCFMDESRFIYHEQTGMAAIPFQSQAGGLFRHLARRTLDKMNPPAENAYRLPETSARLRRMEHLMGETGMNLPQLTLGWLRGQPFVTIPIVGCTREADLRESMSALDHQLTPEQIRFISHGA
ncbi:MAG: aldo/keto reductase [Armatimonadetes bacterium]|nr:aldo/keto reductase [Armatimonadota bacterium]MDE2207595.1 aldo/keto reductase [Armatimonadota bacterium]